jgi:hypothetical protein
MQTQTKVYVMKNLEFLLIDRCLIRPKISSKNNNNEKKLVAAIHRGNKLKTPTIYADLAMSLMCQNDNFEMEVS